jgi:hypothetical protein
MLLNDAMERLNGRPWESFAPSLRPVAPAANGLLRELIAVHESAHCVWNYVEGAPIHDVRVSGLKGTFRPVADAREFKVDQAEPVPDLSASDVETRRVWLHLAAGFMVSLVRATKIWRPTIR